MIETNKENFNPSIFVGFLGIIEMSPLPPVPEEELIKAEQKLLDILKTKESPLFVHF